MPYDTPIAGWRGRHVNALRLVVGARRRRRSISRRSTKATTSAPSPHGRAPKRSRACSIPMTPRRKARNCGCGRSTSSPPRRCRTSYARHLDEHGTLDNLPDHCRRSTQRHTSGHRRRRADADPRRRARLLVGQGLDDHDSATLNYTNHTLLPEALETWPVELLGRLLPRHLQIIYLINWLHLQETSERGLTDPDFLANVSLVHENGNKRVRMAHLAFLGSHCVNGVSALHTDLLRKTVFHDLARDDDDAHRQQDQRHHFPALALRGQRGVDQAADRDVRRTRARRPDAPRRARTRYAGDRTSSRAIDRRGRPTKRGWPTWCARRPASRSIRTRCSTCTSSASTNTSASCSTCWRPSRFIRRCARGRTAIFVPRVKIFAGKAAASYERAKLIIKLVNDVGAGRQ